LSEKAKNEGEEFDFDPLLAVNCIAANKDHKEKIDKDPKLKAEWTKLSASLSGSKDGKESPSLQNLASIRDQLHFANGLTKTSNYVPDDGYDCSCDGTSNAVAVLSVILAVLLLFFVICLFASCRKTRPELPRYWLEWWYGPDYESGNGKKDDDSIKPHSQNYF
jgi:hypothetical protein